MKVYIAAPWTHKSTARLVRQFFQRVGLTVVSRWIDVPDLPDGSYEYPGETMMNEAINNIEDLADADLLFYMNLEKSEGKATELGMAVISKKPIYVVGGKQNNVFLHLPTIHHVDSVETFLERIQEIA